MSSAIGPSGLPLPGLPGTNPLGLFSALGCLAALERAGRSATLRWLDDPIPTPVITGVTDMDDLLDLLVADHVQWADEWIFDCGFDDVKLPEDEIRPFLNKAREVGGRSYDIAAALVAEGSLDNSGAAKPTDFHFTAGRQEWLTMATAIHAAAERADLEIAVTQPWGYPDSSPSLMWDTADDRLYALSATNPAKDKKQTQAGAEWLALCGLGAFPLVTGARTLTPGCAGSWKNGSFTWPVWNMPLRRQATKTLLADAAVASVDGPRLDQLGGLRLYRSEVRRSDQGGYGTFGPAVTLWERRTAIGS